MVVDDGIVVVVEDGLVVVVADGIVVVVVAGAALQHEAPMLTHVYPFEFAGATPYAQLFC